MRDNNQLFKSNYSMKPLNEYVCVQMGLICKREWKRHVNYESCTTVENVSPRVINDYPKIYCNLMIVCRSKMASAFYGRGR